MVCTQTRVSYLLAFGGFCIPKSTIVNRTRSEAQSPLRKSAIKLSAIRYPLYAVCGLASVV
jgi:hypothetical protein